MKFKNDYGPIVLFQVGKLYFTSFGILLGIGTFLGFIQFLFFLGYRGVSLESKLISQLILYIGISIPLGSYLMARITDIPKLITKKLLLKDYFRIPGFSFWGGLILGSINLIIFSFQYQLPLLCLTDSLVIGLSFGQILGRLGCLNYGCCHGVECNNKSWFLKYRHPNSKVYRTDQKLVGKPLYPTQIISSISNLIIWSILIYMAYTNNNMATGILTITYLILFSLKRFIIEFFRGELPRTNYLTFTLWQWLSIILFSIGIYITIHLNGFQLPTKILQSFDLGLTYVFDSLSIVLITALLLTSIYSFHYRKVGSW
jgi:phosphatidylglycerol---prolipoprotein diacylglyceryl transferase